MGEVTSLNGAVPAPGEPDPEVVDFLEKALVSAKRGEIVCLGMAWVDPARAVSWARKGAAYENALVAATTYLWHRMLNQTQETDQVDDFCP